MYNTTGRAPTSAQTAHLLSMCGMLCHGMSHPTLYFSRHPQPPDPEDLKTSLRPTIIIHAVLAQLNSFQTLIALFYLLTYLSSCPMGGHIATLLSPRTRPLSVGGPLNMQDKSCVTTCVRCMNAVKENCVMSTQ